MTITDDGAIKEMREGRIRAVSCGYDAGLVSGKGDWQGIAYDKAMKDIRYNHIALVREGHAGMTGTVKGNVFLDSRQFYRHRQFFIGMARSVLNRFKCTIVVSSCFASLRNKL